MLLQIRGYVIAMFICLFIYLLLWGKCCIHGLIGFMLHCHKHYNSNNPLVVPRGWLPNAPVVAKMTLLVVWCGLKRCFVTRDARGNQRLHLAISRSESPAMVMSLNGAEGTYAWPWIKPVLSQKVWEVDDLLDHKSSWPLWHHLPLSER